MSHSCALSNSQRPHPSAASRDSQLKVGDVTDSTITTFQSEDSSIHIGVCEQAAGRARGAEVSQSLSSELLPAAANVGPCNTETRWFIHFKLSSSGLTRSQSEPRAARITTFFPLNRSRWYSGVCENRWTLSAWIRNCGLFLPGPYDWQHKYCNYIKSFHSTLLAYFSLKPSVCSSQFNHLSPTLTSTRFPSPNSSSSTCVYI